MLSYKKSFSLEVSNNLVKLIELKDIDIRSGSFKVNAFGTASLPSGYVDNYKILKIKEVSDIVKKLLKQTIPKKIKSAHVVVALPEAKIFTYLLEVPETIKDKNVRDYLIEEIEAFFPFNLEDVVWDYKVIKEKKKRQVFWVALEKDIWKSYLDLCKSLNLKVLRFDILSKGTVESIIGKDGIKAPILLMDIGRDSTTLSIYDNYGLRISFSLSVAGDYFNKTISEKLNISEKEAEKLKIKNGLDPEKGKGEIMQILQSQLQQIIIEAKNYISYFEEKKGEKIQKVIITGGSSQLKYLKEYFEGNLSLPVEIGDLKYKIKNKVKDFKPQEYLAGIGLIIRTLKKGKTKEIDLLKKNYINFFSAIKPKYLKDIVLSPLASLIVIFVLLLVAGGIAGGFYWYKYIIFPGLPNEQAVIPSVVEEINYEDIVKNFEYKVGVSFDLEAEADLNGRLTSFQAKGEGEYPVSQKENIDKIAVGKISIINNAEEPAVLERGDILISESEDRFILDKNLTISPGSEGISYVWSESSEQDFDLVINELSFLSTDDRNSDEVLSNLEIVIEEDFLVPESLYILTNTDIDAAQTELAEQVLSEKYQEIEKCDTCYLVPAVVASEMVEVLTIPESGSITESFELSAINNYQIAEVDQESLENMIKQMLYNSFKLEQDVNLNNFDYSFENYNADNKTATLSISFKK